MFLWLGLPLFLSQSQCSPLTLQQGALERLRNGPRGCFLELWSQPVVPGHRVLITDEGLSWPFRVQGFGTEAQGGQQTGRGTGRRPLFLLAHRPVLPHLANYHTQGVLLFLDLQTYFFATSGTEWETEVWDGLKGRLEGGAQGFLGGRHEAHLGGWWTHSGTRGLCQAPPPLVLCLGPAYCSLSSEALSRTVYGAEDRCRAGRKSPSAVGARPRMSPAAAGKPGPASQDQTA